MSIRRALVFVLFGTTVAMTVLLAGLSSYWIRALVLDEVQGRVDHSLDTALTLYNEELRYHANAFERRTRELHLELPDLEARVRAIHEESGLTVLAVCDPEGRPLAGRHPDPEARVPVDDDPVLRRARAGEFSFGSRKLSAARLALEGGAFLGAAMEVRGPEGARATDDALFLWFAAPIKDDDGAVVGIRYGGLALNHNKVLVDYLRAMAFGNKTYEDKPLGTVTIFLDAVRVATNVLGPDGQRALGTEVSEEVASRTLAGGETWHDRAWVVDAWYRSAYQPIRNPDREIIGMLYVGLLETPYRDQGRRVLVSLALGIGGFLLVVLVLMIFVARGITRPLQRLVRAARSMAEARWDQPPAPAAGGFTETRHLEAVFRDMQQAIVERDGALRDRNRALSDANDELARANRSYMEMLGFVTHELKAPVGAIHMMVNTLLGGYGGEVPDHLRHPLERIRKNCEELLDMAREYLDLSRFERGDLVAHREPLDLAADVVAVAVENAEPLLEARGMKVEVDAPPGLQVLGDSGLLRIALGNFLSNAAKYGEAGGLVQVALRADGEAAQLTVRNEGAGFTPQEGERLFGKFSRLDNATTRGARGSGVGLFLVRQIAEVHGGAVAARSEPGHWAEFGLIISLVESH